MSLFWSVRIRRMFRFNFFSDVETEEWRTEFQELQEVIQGASRNLAAGETRAGPIQFRHLTYSAVERQFSHALGKLPLVVLFMSIGWDNVSEMRPPKGLLFISQVMYEYGEARWNNTDRGNRRTRRKTCHSATWSSTNPTWTNPGANPGLCGEKPATNRLSYGTARLPLRIVVLYLYGIWFLTLSDEHRLAGV
jgi:hypothetical protein